MIYHTERIDVRKLTVESPKRSAHFDQLSLIDERHWQWLEDRMSELFEEKRADHVVLEIAASLKVLFPDRFSEIQLPNIDMEKVDFSLFSNPRTFIVLYPGLAYLSYKANDGVQMTKAIETCRAQKQWPEYFKLSSLYRLVEPSFKSAPISPNELVDIDDNTPGGSQTFEFFEDARIAGYDGLLDDIWDYVDSINGFEPEGRGHGYKFKRALFERFGDEVFEDLYQMLDFIELIRQFTVIEASEVLVSKGGIKLLFDNKFEDVPVQLPQSRKF